MPERVDHPIGAFWRMERIMITESLAESWPQKRQACDGCRVIRPCIRVAMHWRMTSEQQVTEIDAVRWLCHWCAMNVRENTYDRESTASVEASHDRPFRDARRVVRLNVAHPVDERPEMPLP